MLVVFVVFNLLRRIADQSKNICDQTVFCVRGVAKIPKVHKVLFLDKTGAGRGLIATAIGRKRFPESGSFSTASPGGGDSIPDEIRSFMEDTGLEIEGLSIDSTEALVHDYSDYDVIVCLNGSIYDYMERVPFHTSAQRWDIPGQEDGEDRGEYLARLYRTLVDQTTQLMELLAGKDAK